jgi:2-succinyl-5-enolpyruvyl-6-hydroxy-3-cyclohexene-1-carboxylate synthase
VVLGDPVATIHRLEAMLQSRPLAQDPKVSASWAAAERTAAAHQATALDAVANNEAMMLCAAVRGCAEVAATSGRAPRLLLGNSLPVRIIDQVSGQTADSTQWLPVATQRGASGIDGLLAGAAGAGHDGRPVLAIIGDVTFAHDVGSLALLAEMRTPVVVMVIDNGGGRIFDHLAVAHAELGDDVYARFFTTAPKLDPVRIAHSFGIAARAVYGADDVGTAIREALAFAGATLIHVPVAADGALAVRNAALFGMQPQLRMVQGATS